MEEREQKDKQLRELIELIHLTENVSTKIHGLLDEANIYRTVIDEFAKSKQYIATIFFLTDDGSKLTFETSTSPRLLRAAEKATGIRSRRYKIDLNNSTILSQVIREEKTLQFKSNDLVVDLSPRPLSTLVSRIMGFGDRSSILTPLKRHGEIIGAFSLDSPELSEYFIPSVISLTQHISTAVDMAARARALEVLHSHATGLGRTETLEEIAETTFNAIEGVLGFNQGGFGVVEDNLLRFIHICGVETGEVFELPLDGPGVTVRTVRTGETQLVSDTRLDEDFVVGLFEGVINSLSEIAIPIKVDGEVVAIINVESNRLAAFTEEDRRLLETLAQHVTSAFSRLRREEELEGLVEEKTEELKVVNLTLQEQNMRLQRLDEMKSRFVSTATHEIRTPLVSIKGYTDFILSGRAGEISERIESMLKIVQRNTDRLSSLTNDLLDIQRIESGRLKISPEPLNIGEVVKEVVEEILPLISEKDQELHVEILEELPIIIADPIRISQILTNLLNNAYQFTPEGGEINLKVNEVPGSVLVEVSDTGIGIKKEDLPKLFSPFPDIEWTSRNGGTGLGLSICKGIIDLHGGTILAESEGEDKGSTFTITLPKQGGTGL